MVATVEIAFRGFFCQRLGTRCTVQLQGCLFVPDLRRLVHHNVLKSYRLCTILG
jgi:hypothetical protein